jgi:hypothetical protein
VVQTFKVRIPVGPLSLLTINGIHGKNYAMDMMTEYAKRSEERKLIKKETRPTVVIGLVLLFLSVIYGVAAYGIKIQPTMTFELLEKIYGIVNLAVVMLLIVILAVRKTIYYSPRFIREDFTLAQVLARWRRIDIVLLAISEVIPLCGLVLTFLGIPFDRNFHFFLVSGLLTIILMPLGIKVRSKLSILRKHFPGI